MRGSREISLVPSLHRASTDAQQTNMFSRYIYTGLNANRLPEQNCKLQNTHDTDRNITQAQY